MADDDQKSGGLKSVLGELPLDRLKDELQDAFKALGEKGLSSVQDKLSGATDSLTGIADGGGVLGKAAKEGTKSAAQGDNAVGGAIKGGLGGVKDKVKNALPGGGGGGADSGSKATKCTNIIEEIDVGVPIDVAYNQWTQFQDFSGFMKKVDSVDEQEDENITFKAQVFWSHRTWEAKVIDQVPNERIIWKSKGEKGHVDGAVTFHELGPNLTRILVVLEYYPQGLFERTGNIWRAQGRRARLELKHFRRHVMTRAILDDDLEGWRGEIHDSEVERDHDEVVEEERERDEAQDSENPDDSDDGDDYGDEPEDEYDEPEDEEGVDDEAEDDEAEDEPEDEAEDEYDEPEDEEGVDDEESEEEYDEPEDELEAEDEEQPEEEEQPEDEYEEEGEPADEEEEDLDDEELEDEYDEPEDEAEEEELEEDEEPEEEPEEEEPEEKPRKRSSSKRSSSRKRR